jgi:RimJ/RimL family protein N-acetyltransferase
MSEMFLRPLAAEDGDFLLRLRNFPSVRKGFFSTAPISRGAHQIWFQQYLEDRSSYCFIAQIKKNAEHFEPIGYCRFDNIGVSSFTVSIAVDPGFQNSGRGLEMLRASLVRLQAVVNGPITVSAEILEHNEASRALFQNAGFFRTDDSLSGRVYMKMEL